VLVAADENDKEKVKVKCFLPFITLVASIVGGYVA
jgi:hypothetical protein